MGSCFKKKIIESANPLHVLWHGVIKGVRQRNVTTCKIIAVLPPLPALGRFNEAKMVKSKPNIFFKKIIFFKCFGGRIDLKEQEEVTLFNLQFLFTCSPWLNCLSVNNLLLFL